MRADVVVDASVLAKCFFFEAGSERAQAMLISGIVVAAPTLILIEIASIGAKKVRRGAATLDLARRSMVSIGDLVDSLTPVTGLASRALVLAADTGCSAYDATYLALAESLGAPVLTADDRFIQRAIESGMGKLVQRL